MSNSKKDQISVQDLGAGDEVVLPGIITRTIAGGFEVELRNGMRIKVATINVVRSDY